MKRRYLFLLIGIAGPGWAEMTMNTHYDPKSGTIWRICVMPAEAKLTRIGMKGGESLSKESQEWAEKLDATLKLAIADAGGRVTGDLSADKLQRDDEALQSVVRLKQKYESIAVQLRKKPGGVEKGRYTMGDEVALAPCAGQADSLAFVEARGLASTNGRTAFDMLVGGVPGLLMAHSRYDIWIALVDSKTGQVTAFLHEIATGGKADSDPDTAIRKGLADGLRRVHVGWVRPVLPSK